MDLKYLMVKELILVPLMGLLMNLLTTIGCHMTKTSKKFLESYLTIENLLKAKLESNYSEMDLLYNLLELMEMIGLD